MNKMSNYTVQEQYQLLHQALGEARRLEPLQAEAEKLQAACREALYKANHLLGWQRLLLYGGLLILFAVNPINWYTSLPGFLLTAAILAAIYLPLRFWLRRGNMAKYAPAAAELDSRREAIDSEIEGCLSQAEHLLLVPDPYRCSHAIASFIAYYESGRALCFKDALDAYITDMHQARLEAQNAEIQQLQAETLREAKRARRSANVAAAASVYNMFKK